MSILASDFWAPYRPEGYGRGLGNKPLRLNQITGAWVPAPSWVAQIDPEDLEWFERQWAEQDAFDYKLLMAGIGGSKPERET